MRYSFALVPLANAIGALAAADSWVFGNTGFYLGPPSGSAEIVKATYSITPPAVPTNYTVSDTSDEVWVSVWVGASASAGSDDYNLYQPLFNWSPDQESQYVHEPLGTFGKRARANRVFLGAAPPALRSGVLPPAPSLLPASLARSTSLSPKTLRSILKVCFNATLCVFRDG